MARVGGVRTLAALGCAAALVCMAACGGGSDGESDSDAPKAAAREHKPLPEEPRIETTASIGTYGGRFIIGETTGPKTFNAMMANETSSTDITGNLFTALADFDNGTQQDKPGLAKSWEKTPDEPDVDLSPAQGRGLLRRASDHLRRRALQLSARLRRHAAPVGAGSSDQQRQAVGCHALQTISPS